MLANKTEYLTAGVHIGMKSCTPYMSQFVYKVRDDGLSVFNLQKVDDRLKIAADFLSRFENIMVVSRKDSAKQAVKAFEKVVGGKAIAGRFSPGTLTNPSYKNFYEPDVIFVVDPLLDEQAVIEAKKKRVPIVAFCDTFNTAKDVDYIVPINNNGKKSLSLAFWVLAREIQKSRGKIKEDNDFKPTLQEFGYGD
jgi:small subunit ribosomal protein S2